MTTTSLRRSAAAGVAAPPSPTAVGAFESSFANGLDISESPTSAATTATTPANNLSATAALIELRKEEAVARQREAQADSELHELAESCAKQKKAKKNAKNVLAGDPSTLSIHAAILSTHQSDRNLSSQKTRLAKAKSTAHMSYKGRKHKKNMVGKHRQRRR